MSHMRPSIEIIDTWHICPCDLIQRVVYFNSEFTLPAFNAAQDAALMLEHSTNRHTEQLREIFCQAGKLYGSEIEK